MAKVTLPGGVEGSAGRTRKPANGEVSETQPKPNRLLPAFLKRRPCDFKLVFIDHLAMIFQ